MIPFRFFLLSSLLPVVAEATDGSIRRSSSRLLVSCGGHDASACQQCGTNDSFCNGDCEWIVNECKPKTLGVPDPSPTKEEVPTPSPSDMTINYGGADASTCQECGPNESCCNGDCEWIANECKLKTLGVPDPSPTKEEVPTPSPADKTVSCGGSNALTCQECGPDGSFCNGDCKWISSLCRLKTEEFVSCGGKNVLLCGQCGGKEGCNGDCEWKEAVCKPRISVFSEHNDFILEICLGVLGLIGVIVAAWCGREKLITWRNRRNND